MSSDHDSSIGTVAVFICLLFIPAVCLLSIIIEKRNSEIEYTKDSCHCNGRSYEE